MRIELDACGHRYFMDANFVCFANKDRVSVCGVDFEKNFNRSEVDRIIVDGKMIDNEFWDSIPDKKVTD
jgi:hypothetical protein